MADMFAQLAELELSVVVDIVVEYFVGTVELADHSSVIIYSSLIRYACQLLASCIFSKEHVFQLNRSYN